MAAPWRLERSTRRSELPRVVPKPRSSGSATNLPYVWDSVSWSTSIRLGLMRSRQFRATNMSAMLPSLLPSASPPTYPPSWREDEALCFKVQGPHALLGCGPKPRRDLMRARRGGSLRVELDDELLLDGHREIFPVRDLLDGALERLLVELHPLRDAAPVHGLQGLGDAQHLAALLGDLDGGARAHPERW